MVIFLPQIHSVLVIVKTTKTETRQITESEVLEDEILNENTTSIKIQTVGNAKIKNKKMPVICVKFKNFNYTKKNAVISADITSGKKIDYSIASNTNGSSSSSKILTEINGTLNNENNDGIKKIEITEKTEKNLKTAPYQIVKTPMIYIPRVLPYPDSTSWVSSKTNTRTERDDNEVRFHTYISDTDKGLDVHGIDIYLYKYV